MSDEQLPGPTEPGRVVLDIGGEVGAAIVVVPASFTGLEIEIRAAGARWDGRHVAVLERLMPNGSTYAAVFGSLTEGGYEVCIRHDPASAVVPFDVTGGRVTNVEWPAAGG